MSEQELQQRAERNVGRVLRAKWRLDRVLGVGGMASVYAATHRNGMRGAVKLLHPELGLRDDVRDRFLREGYVANRVEHPGAVRVLDDDADDGAVFLVMELLDGKTVDALANEAPGQVLDVPRVDGLAVEELHHEEHGAVVGVVVEHAHGAVFLVMGLLDGKTIDTLTLEAPGQVLDVPRVVDIAIQLLDVLAAAHAKKIVHRDLKPENLFLTTEGQVKILDFGIARLHDMSSGASGTKTGSLIGTPAFMSPEHALGNWDQVDGRTDLYAVGATMFVLLTGQLVHEAASLNQLLLAAMTKPARPIASVRPDLPKDLAAVVDRALAFDREARWQDARATPHAQRRHGAPPATPTVPSAPGPMRAQPFSAPTAVAHMPTEAVPSRARSRAAVASDDHGGRRLERLAGAALVVARARRSSSRSSAARCSSRASPSRASATPRRARLAATSAAAPEPSTSASAAPTASATESAERRGQRRAVDDRRAFDDSFAAEPAASATTAPSAEATAASRATAPRLHGNSSPRRDRRSRPPARAAIRRSPSTLRE